MSFFELVLLMLGYAIPCLLAALAMSKWSAIPASFHAELNYVCLSVLLPLAFIGASSSRTSSYSGLQGAAATAVFIAFALVMAFRRCLKGETRISGIIFFLFAAFIMFTFAKALPR